jgi:hypothetical protein
MGNILSFTDIGDTPYGRSLINKSFRTKEPLSILTRSREPNGGRAPIVCRSDSVSSNLYVQNYRIGEMKFNFKESLVFTIVEVCRWESSGTIESKIYIQFRSDLNIDSDIQMYINDFVNIENNEVAWVPSRIDDYLGSSIISENGTKLLLQDKKFELDSSYDGFIDKQHEVNFEDYPSRIVSKALEQV